MLTISSRTTLNDGTSMPLLGLGVFKATEGGEVDPFEPVD